MKVDPVINNNDELFISNMAQMQKIKYLQTQKAKRQAYIKDLQQSLILNKQSLSTLASNNQAQGLKKLNQQNILLHSKLKKYYEDYMNVNALLLIEQQVRMEEKKFYSQRSLEFQTKMIQLRKYLQDKQDSFSSVVGRLKKYQDLAQVTLQTKLHKLSNELAQQHLQNIFKTLSEDRDKYKSAFDKFIINVNDISFLKNCLEDKKSYQAMQIAYLKIKQQQIKQLKQGKQQKGISFYEKTKNTTNASSNTSSNTFNKNGDHNIPQAPVKNPHRELIKLLKKQKLNNEILQQALNQAIEKNQQLIQQNNVLVEANMQLQIKIQKLQSKGYVLEQELTRYDRSLALKQAWKTKCDLDRQQRIKQFEYKGEQNEICMVAMQQDMEKLSSFLITCVPKGHLVKSSSNPNFARRNEDVIEENDDLQIEQL